MDGLLRLAVSAGLLLIAPASPRAGEWIRLNPGGGGAFTVVGAGPTGTIIAGSDLSGAYRSRDRGLTWDAIGANRGLRRTHVSALGFDPQDGAIIHLGTDRGIYRSTDGGDAFHQVMVSGYIGALAPARSDPAIVYAAHHDTYKSTASDIYRSTDRGQTWSPLHSALPAGLRVLELAVSPARPTTLYLVSGSDLFVTATPALYRSLDGGLSWTRIGAGLGNIWDLGLDPVTPSTLYVTVYRGTPGSRWSGAVYQSLDGGDTWTEKAAHTGAIMVKRDAPQVVRVIDAQRHSSEGESGVWESPDGGDTWRKRSPMAGWDSGWARLDWAYGGNGYGTPKILGEDLSDPDVILWCDWYFVLGSFDGGGRFQNLTTTRVAPDRWRSRGIDNVTVAALATSEADPNHLYVGYHDLGLWRSLDGGASWQAGNSPAFTGTWKGNGGNVATIVADPARTGVLWAANGRTVDQASMARSEDAGAPASWTAVTGLPSGFLKGLSLSRTSPVHRRTLFITANGGVFRSQDDGRSWAQVLDGKGCRSTAVDPFDGRLAYAGGEGGLWRSESGGDPGTWSAIGPAEFQGRNPRPPKDEQWEGVHQIAVDPRQPGWLYVTSYGTGRGLYRSTDRGATWTRLRGSTFMRGVAVDPRDSNVIYVTTSAVWKSGGDATSGSEGLLRSRDGGQSWASLADGLPWPFGGPVALDPGRPDRVLLGSPGTGFLERTVSASAEDSAAEGGVRR